MQLRTVTKGLIGAVFTISSFLLLPGVNEALRGAVNGHPRLAVVVSGLITLATILHRPEVVRAFGLEVRNTTVQVVPLAEGIDGEPASAPIPAQPKE